MPKNNPFNQLFLPFLFSIFFSFPYLTRAQQVPAAPILKIPVAHLVTIDTIEARPVPKAFELPVFRLNGVDTILVFAQSQSEQELGGFVSVELLKLASRDTISGRLLREDTLKLEVVKLNELDSINATIEVLPLTEQPNYNSRIWANTALHAGLYAGSLLALNQAWYAGYERGSFRVFNDNAEWLQVDKVGHTWSAYQLSRVSMATWKWAGLSEKKQIWIGGLAGTSFQTVIEVLDGFSAGWGWSWGDIAANFAGSGLLIGQQLGWKEQRISFKYSFHKKTYADALLMQRTNQLSGKSLPERALKDYNGQTYWLSVNLKAFMPRSNLPPWLNLALGYGADGMFGGTENTWTDEQSGTHFNRTDLPRYRQIYLSPDIDFTRIPTNKKWLKTVFFVLNGFKFPAPALVMQQGKMGFHWFYF